MRLETGFPQRFAAAPSFLRDWFGFVALVCRMLVETNPKDPYQLGISVREFVYRKPGKCGEFPAPWKSPPRVGRFVKDQLDAEQNDAFVQQVPIILGGFNLKVRDVLQRMFGGKTL